ncbi:hypothetical protein H7H73_00385, partial [Mycobacterium rufum]|nr:hypothetical protein [Mycolicibacterium rufum]
LTGRDRLLFDQVTASLRETDQFEQIFEADDTTGIDKLRSIGRAWDGSWAGKFVHSPQPSTADGARAHRGRAVHAIAGTS